MTTATSRSTTSLAKLILICDGEIAL
uniref:Uncharacterized protein n=1 Tax=Oryza glumipatula TaxID=40148 RepID=A0A0E0BHN6_9ORYZ